LAIDGRDADQQELMAGELTVIPALFEHAQKVYAAMLEKATPDEDYGNKMVYEGHLTNLFKGLLLSVPYYTEIKNHLTAMGCIEQVRRGGGNGTSRWVLWKAPELSLWKDTPPARSHRGNKQTMQNQQLKDLANRVTRLETIIQGLMERV